MNPEEHFGSCFDIVCSNRKMLKILPLKRIFENKKGEKRGGCPKIACGELDNIHGMV